MYLDGQWDLFKRKFELFRLETTGDPSFNRLKIQKKSHSAENMQGWALWDFRYFAGIKHRPRARFEPTYTQRGSRATTRNSLQHPTQKAKWQTNLSEVIETVENLDSRGGEKFRWI